MSLAHSSVRLVVVWIYVHARDLESGCPSEFVFLVHHAPLSTDRLGMILPLDEKNLAYHNPMSGHYISSTEKYHCHELHRVDSGYAVTQ